MPIENLCYDSFYAWRTSTVSTQAGYHVIQACMHTYINTCMYAYMHACKKTYVHACMQKDIHTCKHLNIYMCTYMHIYIYAGIQTYKYVNTTLKSTNFYPRISITNSNSKDSLITFSLSGQCLKNVNLLVLIVKSLLLFSLHSCV